MKRDKKFLEAFKNYLKVPSSAGINYLWCVKRARVKIRFCSHISISRFPFSASCVSNILLKNSKQKNRIKTKTDVKFEKK